MAIGLAAGADAYLTKPFRPRALRERLAEILQGASE
jgi:DNA-binding response OmpR family regulator